MHKLLMICFLVCCVCYSLAQYPTYKPLTDITAFKNQFVATAQKTNSIRCDFTQEKNLNMISEKINSKGKFWFQKENKVRMEYTHPFEYLIIINDKKVFMKDGQRENTVSTGSSKLFQQISRIMLDCVRGTALDNPDFKVKVFENTQSFLIEMTPVAKAFKEYFKNILITVNKNDYLVNSIRMNEPEADFTLIHFSNQELNAKLADALFTIK